MALKLTRTAAETLNDILLNELQQHGLEKMETLESLLFKQINELPDADGPGDTELKTIFPGGDFAFIYRHLVNNKVLLAIVHLSRLPTTANL